MRWAPGLARLISWLWSLLGIRLSLARRQMRAVGLGHLSTRRVAGHLAETLLDLLSLDHRGWWCSPPPPVRRAVVVSAHLGPWEGAGGALTRAGWPITAIIRPPRRGAGLLARLRRRSDLYTVEEGGAISRSADLLRSGRWPLFMGDLHAPGRLGQPGRFLGRPALLSRAPALLACRHGCPLLVVTARRGAGGREVHLRAVLHPRGRNQTAVADLVNRASQVLERAILEDPEQWIWVHRRWKPDPRLP